jgi:phospholipid N-methyltransferase
MGRVSRCVRGIEMSLAILGQFLKNPKHIGAIAPSSRALSRRIVSDSDIESASVILEYGPGTGVFTRQILKAKNPGAVFAAIERNELLAARFRVEFPGVPLYEDSAENAPGIIRHLGADKVDCVISGLPWAAFDDGLQDRLIDATLEVLREGGTFVTFAYLQGLLLRSGKRFAEKLKSNFSRVSRSGVVWWNLPPAFVYRCTR